MMRWLCVALMVLAAPAAGQPYEGPPNGADYWTVPGFKEHPIRGPQQAKGLVLWSHGVYGRQIQYTSPPAPVVRRFARDGWDVIKVQRNPRNERGWIPSGVRHVNDLVARAEQAKAAGYRQVVAGGQSYGGAISIEAAGRTRAIDGVLALAPGHGSDATGDGRARMFDSLTDQLIGAIGKVQAPRLLVMIAENDIYHPFEVRGPRLRVAIQQRGQSFVLFDETMPLKGHGAGTTVQFDQWYGACVHAFLTKPQVAPGETRCEGPQVIGRFAVPRDLTIQPPAASAPTELVQLSGRWSGSLTGIAKGDRGIMVIFEKIEAKGVSFVYALDGGARNWTNPSYSRRSATWDGKMLESRNSTGQFKIVFSAPGEDGALNVSVTDTKGALLKATLRKESDS